MAKLIIRQVVMISEQQAGSLGRLKSHNVNVGQFIRDAIREKINRDWITIRDKKVRDKF